MFTNNEYSTTLQPYDQVVAKLKPKGYGAKIFGKLLFCMLTLSLVLVSANAIALVS